MPDNVRDSCRQILCTRVLCLHWPCWSGPEYRRLAYVRCLYHTPGYHAMVLVATTDRIVSNNISVTLLYHCEEKPWTMGLIHEIRRMISPCRKRQRPIKVK